MILPDDAAPMMPAPYPRAPMASEESRRAALQAYVDAFNRSDAEAIIALFADDATVEDPYGRPPMVGKATIAPFFKFAVDSGAKLKLCAPIRASQGDAAAMCFDVTVHYMGANQLIRVIDVMTFNEQGLIKSMKAYWGLSDMQAQG
jgi:steroid delta-isomerase